MVTEMGVKLYFKKWAIRTGFMCICRRIKTFSQTPHEFRCLKTTKQFSLPFFAAWQHCLIHPYIAFVFRNSYRFTKLSQTVFLINTHIFICQHVRCTYYLYKKPLDFTIFFRSFTHNQQLFMFEMLYLHQTFTDCM